MRSNAQPFRHPGYFLSFILLFIVSVVSFAQQIPKTEAISQGACSPNILSNQGKVQFTCNTQIDAGSVHKIVSLLNQILQKGERESGPPTEVNQKLDEILKFMHRQEQESSTLRNDVSPRHITPQQHDSIVSQLRSKAGTEITVQMFPGGGDTQGFGQELISVLQDAGFIVSFSSVLLMKGPERITGLHLQCGPDSLSSARAIAQALGDARVTKGDEDRVLNVDLYQSGAPPLTLFVGPKPTVP